MRSTASRIASATTVLLARATSSGAALLAGAEPLAAVRMLTSLSSESNPMSARETSLTTSASRPLARSFSRATATASAPCSAANPTSVWPSRRWLARAARGHEHRKASPSRAASAERARERSLAGVEQLRGLGQPADALLARRGQAPYARRHDLDAARAQRLQVFLRGRVLVHAVVH